MEPEESKRSVITSTSLQCCSSLAWSPRNRPLPARKREQRRRPGREFRLRDIGSVGHEQQSHPDLCFKHRRGCRTEFGLQGVEEMSENYRFYVAKMADARARRLENRPLLSQSKKLFRPFHNCESTCPLDNR